MKQNTWDESNPDNGPSGSVLTDMTLPDGLSSRSHVTGRQDASTGRQDASTDRHDASTGCRQKMTEAS